jgi:hypothetical protein
VLAPALRITTEAKCALEAALAASGLPDPRATILWATEVPAGSVDEMALRQGDPEALRRSAARGKWSVQFYDGGSISWFQKCTVEGLPFCFVQAKYRRLLNGATLAFENGRFTVAEGAI